MMATLRLQISDKALDKVLWLLSHFSKDEVEIIEEDLEFLKQKQFVQDELKRMDDGAVDFISIDELKHQVSDLLARYEA